MEITVEPDPNSNPTSSHDVVYAGAIPPQALVHIKHLLVAFDTTPGQIGLTVGLLQQATVLNTTAQEMLTAAQQAGDLAAMRRAAEGIVNLIADRPAGGRPHGRRQPTNPGDSFGLLPNGNNAGYIEGTLDHAQLAAGQPDRTENIKLHAAHVVVAATNLSTWAVELRDRAVRIATTTDVAAAGADAQQVAALADRFLNGKDLNGNEVIDPLPNEAGAKTAYQHAGYLADMDVVAPTPGTPGPAKTVDDDLGTRPRRCRPHRPQLLFRPRWRRPSRPTRIHRCPPPPCRRRSRQPRSRPSHRRPPIGDAPAAQYGYAGAAHPASNPDPPHRGGQPSGGGYRAFPRGGAARSDGRDHRHDEAARAVRRKSHHRLAGQQRERRELEPRAADAGCSGNANFSFFDPGKANLLKDYDKFVVTTESMDSKPTTPSTEIILSAAGASPGAGYIRQLLVSDPDTPNKTGLAVEMYAQVGVMYHYTELLNKAYGAHDLAAMKAQAEQLVNLIEGPGGPNYGDLDKDGKVVPAGDGYGLLQNGAQAGYLGGVSAQAAQAAAAPDATDAIKQHAGNVAITAKENVRTGS